MKKKVLNTESQNYNGISSIIEMGEMEQESQIITTIANEPEDGPIHEWINDRWIKQDAEPENIQITELQGDLWAQLTQNEYHSLDGLHVVPDDWNKEKTDLEQETKDDAEGNNSTPSKKDDKIETTAKVIKYAGIAVIAYVLIRKFAHK